MESLRRRRSLAFSKKIKDKDIFYNRFNRTTIKIRTSGLKYRSDVGKLPRRWVLIVFGKSRISVIIIVNRTISSSWIFAKCRFTRGPASIKIRKPTSATGKEHIVIVDGPQQPADDESLNGDVKVCTTSDRYNTREYLYL